MKFRFSSGITLAFGKYEPALKWCTQAFCQKAKARKLRFLPRLISINLFQPH